MNITENQKFWLESNFVVELLKQLPAYVFWKNTKSVYLGCNNAFAYSLGLSSPDEIVGKTDYDLPTTKEESDAFRADDKQVIESKQPKLNIEECQTLPDGSRINLLTNKVPLLDKQKNVIGILGIYYNVTQLKQKEDDLRKEKERAELADRLKTEFIENMKHDIITPCTGIHGLVSSLWRNEENKGRKNLLAYITQSSEELLNFCKSILDFSHVESGTIPLVEKKFNLKKLLKSVISLETSAAKFKELSLNLSCPQSLPKEIIGDDYRLQRLLIGLVSNAIKFTHKGEIKLLVKLAKVINNRKVILVFSVTDTGIGISLENKSIIYEKFMRLSQSSKGLHKGAGLGLKIIKQFITEMDGEIDLESEEGKGSTFYCILPFKLPLLSEFEEK